MVSEAIVLDGVENFLFGGCADSFLHFGARTRFFSNFTKNPQENA